MEIDKKEGIYRVMAGNPKDAEKEEIFLKENMAFEEADTIFNSLLEKQRYPVILLDAGDITIRGFRAPDTDEHNQWYTILKENVYKKNNPDYKPHYVVMAWENHTQDTSDTGVVKTTHKLLENDDFNDAFTSYTLYVERFNDYGSQFDGVKLIDSMSNRLIDSAAIIHNNQTESKEPKRKKKEDPGYER